MRSKLARLLWMVAMFDLSVAAQNVTVPASLHGVEGGGGTSIPFGSSLACRLQCAYDAEELPWVGPRVITGISLRADNSVLGAIAAKGYIDISILMSTTSKAASEVSPTFAENRGIDATWVVNHALVQLPAQPLVPPGPRPANITFPFAVPWAYGLTPATTGLPAPDTLLVELWIHSQPSGIYRLDTSGSCTSPTSDFGTVGPACHVPALPPIELTTDPSMQGGNPFSWHVANMPPSVPFLVSLNLSNSGGLLGNPALPLPYPLFDPQNPSQPPPPLAALLWPATDCWLNIDPSVVLAGLGDGGGFGSVTGLLPAGRQYVGMTFYAQAIVLAPTANPLRIVTSLGHGSTICGPLGVVRIHQFYNAFGTPPPPPPTMGQVQYGVSLIFDVQ